MRTTGQSPSTRRPRHDQGALYRRAARTLRRPAIEGHLLAAPVHCRALLLDERDPLGIDQVATHRRHLVRIATVHPKVESRTTWIAGQDLPRARDAEIARHGCDVARACHAH